MTVIGVCGYGFSGSSALVSLLKEYEETSTFKSGRLCEFAFPYEPDGLLDLEYNLLHAPAKHLKGDMAIHRFIQYTNFIKKTFDRETDGAFSRLTEEYIRSLIQVTYKCRRTSDHRNNQIGIFLEKLMRTIQIKLENRFKCSIKLLKEDDRYISVCPNGFIEKTRKYVSNLLMAAGVGAPNSVAIVDQPFPPNNPEQVFHFFEDPYAIVVDRDPRDIYLTVKNLRFSTARFVPHDDVFDFISYFKAVSVHKKNEDGKRILRIHFEDLIYDYKNTVQKIENFLGIHQHNKIKQFFNPDVSIKNTQLSYVFPDDAKNVKIIEEKLADYLYPFDAEKKAKDRENIFKMASW